MTGDLTIRSAGEADIPRLLDLYRHLNPDDLPADPKQARDALARLVVIPGSAVLLAEDTDPTEAGGAGTLVGSVTLVVIPNLSRSAAPYALIENVVTHAEHRRRGIGRALLHDAARRAWAEGCYKVMLMTGSTRPSTLAFYRAAGFTQDKTGFQMRRLGRRRDG
ncbi:N-acetyltransferase family protein [Marinibacterium sp. SX1]|uniref:GNAT family N-acetyltransferase n=1 Tax=Marinibacterium sp. SX1 TaxID=3388424 RepID=UPI003D162EE6